MNTKTNYGYASNSYNGGIMGSDSPAALLDMLAEVASQTLHSEKKRHKSLLASQCKPKTDFVKRKTQEASFNVQQLLSMPASQLVKQFSVFTSDELKRQYSYTCALIVGCGQKYTSFASEGRARMSIKAHLAEHLDDLKTNEEAYNSFTAKSINYKNCKPSPQNKKNRLQQSKKPQETLNKENKNVIVEKSTNYLRNILLNDISFKGIEKSKSLEKIETSKRQLSSEQKDPDKIDFKVLGDHSYFERLKDEVPNEKEQSSLTDVLDDTVMDENIVLMVVGADSVHMKEYSHINQKIHENVNQDSETVYLPEIPWQQDDSCNKNVEITTTTKPKGKAKFIGTSKEEKEMALAFMDRIKKKGNPTGSNLECRICNPPRSFTAPTTLVSHYRSHAGIKPYECRICRAVFTRRHSLKYHMLIHQNQTRFTCADCGKKFRHPSHFREHRRRHTGEAPFGCDDCGQRFKTRNTYKRHLKTRHGKVLTTTGELLFLSEEDFQKVRTNKKKKNDLTKEHLVDENVIATKAIMNYRTDNDQDKGTVDTSEEYIVNGDDDMGNRNWGTNGTIQIIDKQFETYEVCPESLPIKTETRETEVPINTRVFDENTEQDDYAGTVQDNFVQLQSASYNCFEMIKEEENQIVCSDDQCNFIYDGVNETPSYITVNGAEEEGSVTEYKEKITYFENQIKSPAEMREHNEEDYCNNSPNNEIVEEDTKYIDCRKVDEEDPTEINDKNCNKQLIVKQKKGPGKMDVSVDPKYLIVDGNISQNVETSECENTLQNQSKERILKKDKNRNSCQDSVADLIKSHAITSSTNFSEKNRKHISHQVKQHLYVHNEPLTGIILQNNYINILPSQFNASNEQQNKARTQPTKHKKFMLLNKQASAVNIKQAGKQSAILLLTNDTLKNSIFRIDQNNGADNGMKKQIVDRSK